MVSRGPIPPEKEIVTMEQILAALGPRDPPAARSQKVFNIGFVYLLEPGQAPDQDQLGFHALSSTERSSTGLASPAAEASSPPSFRAARNRVVPGG